MFIQLIDKLTSALHQRHDMYKTTCHYFGFLTQLGKQTDITDIHKSACILQTKYSSDLDEQFPAELLHVLHFVKDAGSTSPLDLLILMKKNELSSVFPNVDIARRIYLTLPVSNASGERSFSKLGLIKNRLRMTMSEHRLNHLTMLSL